jgi:hypothetical protein
MLYPLLLPYATHNVVIVGGVACRGAVPFFLGLLAATLERWQVAADHFEDACVRHERIGAWPLLAPCAARPGGKRSSIVAAPTRRTASAARR